MLEIIEKMKNSVALQGSVYYNRFELFKRALPVAIL